MRVMQVSSEYARHNIPMASIGQSWVHGYL